MKVIKRIIGIIVLIAIIITTSLYLNRSIIDQSSANSYLKKDSCYRYYYQLLDKEHQNLYAKLYYAFAHRTSTLELKDVKKEDIDKAYKYVCYDHPELYYVNKTYQYVDMFNVMEIKLNYNYSKEKCAQYNKELNTIVEEINSQTKSLSALEKTKYIYDYIIEHVSYKQTSNDQDLISALIDGKSVCAGYAKAYQYLLEKAGISCVYLQGNAKEVVNKGDDSGHAWLMLNILGDYYYSDVTWGDVTTKGFEHTCYATFLMNDQEMLKEYTPEDHYEKTSSSSFDYYKNIHCYMNGYSEDVLSYALRYNILNNRNIVEIKCNSGDTFNTLLTQLQTTQVLYTLLEKNGQHYTKASYVSREELNILEVHFYN